MKEFKVPVKRCFIHCSATPPSADIGDDEIKSWHKAKGWLDIGYHVVIRRDGTVEYGRAFDEIGAHVKGHNNDSIGVCLVGGVMESNVYKAENNFTDRQWRSLRRVSYAIQVLFCGIEFYGHYEVDPNRECPSFDMDKWRDLNNLRNRDD
jgi:N-acetylmuramoyl-L-alanine amidase